MTDKHAPKGQEKLHTATRTDSVTGEVETKVFTQAEWKARDKAEGWTRVENGLEDDEPEA